ncbi:MAG: sporulation integral membrane protein YtvI [Eubacteriales bacterium]|jgi:sporulation integral membrane protein YtvI
MKKDQTERRKAFIINLLYYVAIVAIIYVCFKYLLSWLTPFIIGFVIAAIFNPAIKLLEKRLRIGRKAIASIVVVLGYAVLVSLLALILIQVITVLKRLFTHLPGYFENQILPSLMQLDFRLDSVISLPPEWQEQVRSIQESITSGLMDSIGKLSSTGLSLVTNITKGIPAFLVSMVFTILASFFFSYQYDKTKRFILLQLPERARILVHAIKSTLSDTILRYLRGYVKIMLITFVELSIGLSILGVHNAIPVAFGISLFDVLPVLGTGGIVIPWAVFSLLSDNIFLGIGLLVLYAAVTIIRNFIEPKIIGDQLGLNPIVSIISIYLGFVWIGVGGMILMPITVQILTTLHQKGIIRLYNEDTKNISDTPDNTSTSSGKTSETSVGSFSTKKRKSRSDDKQTKS